MVLSNEHPGALPAPDQGSAALNRNATMLARLIAEGRLGPGVGVTARGRKDGAGVQAMAILSAMAMARFVGCSYRHSPFASVAHAEGTPEDWARRWEGFLNFGDGEALVPEDAELVPMSAALQDPDAYHGRPIVIVEPVFGLSGEVGVAIRDALRAELRARYWRGPKVAIPSHRAPEGLTAAVHLRRGDVSLTRNANRYAPDEVVLRQIARLREAVAPFGRTLTVNLYSEGTVEDFRAFADAGCILHVSEDTFESFHNMVTADILVNATSTFSYVAGLLSRGIVLDHRRGTPGFSDWVNRRGNGDISIKRVRQALLARSGWLERCAFQIRRRWPRQ
jgi:hypothetical protein